MSPTDDDSPLFNTSLAKGLAVLMAFGSERRSMNLPEIGTIAGIGKSAAQRFTYTLERLGYLRKDPVTKRYSLTPKVLELGLHYVHADALVEHANPYLLDLNIKCGETVNLSEPDGTDMVFVARFPGHKSIAVHMPLGRRLPMYCTASGRAYLSARPEAEMAEIIARSTPVAYTSSTTLDPARIRKMVRQAHRDGYAYADQEYYRGDINVGAPILGADGWAIAAINISVPVSRWRLDEACRQLAPLVIETARAISGMSAIRRKSLAR
ncbi:MAG TPA: IclR family transcriptional regulator [Alphaproteobacteria bacterium]|nr:IclR family transcriptional regulator [Alphaproteobacteria bacterium]